MTYYRQRDSLLHENSHLKTHKDVFLVSDGTVGLDVRRNAPPSKRFIAVNYAAHGVALDEIIADGGYQMYTFPGIDLYNTMKYLTNARVHLVGIPMMAKVFPEITWAIVPRMPKNYVDPVISAAGEYLRVNLEDTTVYGRLYRFGDNAAKFTAPKVRIYRGVDRQFRIKVRGEDQSLRARELTELLDVATAKVEILESFKKELALGAESVEHSIAAVAATVENIELSHELDRQAHRQLASEMSTGELERWELESEKFSESRRRKIENLEMELSYVSEVTHPARHEQIINAIQYVEGEISKGVSTVRRDRELSSIENDLLLSLEEIDARAESEVEPSMHELGLLAIEIDEIAEELGSIVLDIEEYMDNIDMWSDEYNTVRNDLLQMR